MIDIPVIKWLGLFPLVFYLIQIMYLPFMESKILYWVFWPFNSDAWWRTFLSLSICLGLGIFLGKGWW